MLCSVWLESLVVCDLQSFSIRCPVFLCMMPSVLKSVQISIVIYCVPYLSWIWKIDSSTQSDKNKTWWANQIIYICIKSNWIWWYFPRDKVYLFKKFIHKVVLVDMNDFLIIVTVLSLWQKQTHHLNVLMNSMQEKTILQVDGKFVLIMLDEHRER